MISSLIDDKVRGKQTAGAYFLTTYYTGICYSFVSFQALGASATEIGALPTEGATRSALDPIEEQSILALRTHSSLTARLALINALHTAAIAHKVLARTLRTHIGGCTCHTRSHTRHTDACHQRVVGSTTCAPPHVTHCAVATAWHTRIIEDSVRSEAEGADGGVGAVAATDTAAGAGEEVQVGRGEAGGAGDCVDAGGAGGDAGSAHIAIEVVGGETGSAGVAGIEGTLSAAEWAGTTSVGYGEVGLGAGCAGAAAGARYTAQRTPQTHSICWERVGHTHLASEVLLASHTLAWTAHAQSCCL